VFVTDAIHSDLPPGAADHAFARRVRSAVAWRWGSQVLAQVIAWTSTIAVVRLLDPSDYGLYAMCQVVLTALTFLNGQSFATSLVQTDHIDERRIGQVFGLLLLLNGSLAAIQFLTAPLAAAYFREPQVADMLRIQAVIFLTIPFAAVPQELLARRIEFRNQGIVNLASAAVGGLVAFGLAWLGYGVWALVFAPVAMFATRAIGLSLAARIFIKPVFDFRGAGDLITFGGTLTLCQFMWIIQSQSDVIIAGRSFDTHDLGLYTNALFLTLIITGKFLPPINEVAYAAYSELHKAGKALAPYFLRTLRTVLLVTAPLYFGLALTADPAVRLLFGDKWAEMAPIVAGLSLAMPFFAVQIVCSPATNAMGLPRVYLTTNTIGAVLFPLLFASTVDQGLNGLVHAWWIGTPLLLLTTLLFVLPKVALPWQRLVHEMLPILLASGVMALAVWLARDWVIAWPPLAQIAVLVPLGGASYLATLYLVARTYLEDSWAMIRQRELAEG
jgi:O-antigen/teichoic acid export membrane protein